MKFLSSICALGAFVFLSGAHAAANQESFQAALQSDSAAQASQYSFADVYRLTVSAPTFDGFAVTPGSDAPVRVAAVQPPPRFSVALPEPKPALLLLSGVVLALWIARRSLGYTF